MKNSFGRQKNGWDFFKFLFVVDCRKPFFRKDSKKTMIVNKFFSNFRRVRDRAPMRKKKFPKISKKKIHEMSRLGSRSSNFESKILTYRLQIDPCAPNHVKNVDLILMNFLCWNTSETEIEKNFEKTNFSPKVFLLIWRKKISFFGS